jgi:hypothetical protein
VLAALQVSQRLLALVVKCPRFSSLSATLYVILHELFAFAGEYSFFEAMFGQTSNNAAKRVRCQQYLQLLIDTTVHL